MQNHKTIIEKTAAGLNFLAAKLELIVIIVLIAVFALSAWHSLQWHVEHDAAIMLYLGFLIEGLGYIPYRDFFDMNVPGTHLAYAGLGALFGYSDFAVRSAELLILSLILIPTWSYMRCFGRITAWSSVVLFGLIYLRQGAFMGLQREFLILLPLAISLWIAGNTRQSSQLRRSVIIGILFGISATMKPHSVIAFPCIIIVMLLKGQNSHNVNKAVIIKNMSAAIGGFLLPVAVILSYLLYNDALLPFLEIAHNYWPLYTSISGDHSTIRSGERIAYILDHAPRMGGYLLWLLPALIGVFITLKYTSISQRQRLRLYLLIAAVCCYALYPIIAGQFWEYHWYLFVWCVIQLSALCFGRTEYIPGKSWRFLPSLILVTVIVLGIRLSDEVSRYIRGYEKRTPNQGVVEDIATFLSVNMEPGDKVQPLDWTGGVVHAMLRTRARPATHFIYDFHFYHHVSSPYIQNLRRRFAQQLQSSKPRYIIRITSEEKPWVAGEDTTREFIQLDSLITASYRVVLHGNGFEIHERLLKYEQ